VSGYDWTQVHLPGIDPATFVVVFGAGGEIGGETARAFAALGATVGLVTRSARRSRALADALGGRAIALTADLADSDSLRELAATVAQRVGAPDILVNSAAIGAPRGDFSTVDRTQATTIFDINVVGALEAIKAFAGPMRARGGGRIVNVASVAAQRVLPGSSAYGASKAALVSLTQHLAVDLGPDGITVNSVSPGQTPTRLREWDEESGAAPAPVSGGNAAGVPLGRRGRTSDYVGAILFLCSSLAEYITGVDVPVEGGGRLVRAKSY
jgi:NAD(P)-dependent dehydrogenase (short-subunit alcohol dehydrogenase family)